MNPAIWIVLGAIALAGGIYYMRSAGAACAPAGPRRVIALGDSLTASGEWAAELQRLLPPGSTVKAFGYAGKGSGYILERFREILPTMTGATDLVVLAGVNDLPTKAPMPASSTISATQGNLATIYQAANNAGLRVVGVNLTPWGSYVGTYGGYNSLTPRLNAWITATAPVSVNTEGLGIGGKLDARFDRGDHLHLNSRGQVELGRMIFAQAFRACK